ASVYKTIDIITKQWYAIKLELSLDGNSSVEREYSLLRDLNRAGIPHVHWFGRESNYDALVLNLLGPSLHQIMSQRKKLHLCTIVLLANQLISSLQYIHSRGFIHGDIKPQNIMMGLGSEALTVFIMDFGLAKQFCHLNTGLHILFHRSHHLMGTPAFASINSHLGAELGCRDDLESLVYVLIYFACSSLPCLDKANGLGSSVPLILNIKQMTPVELLCSGLPREFATLLTYTRSLSFSEEPDYNYIRLLFTALQNEIPDLEALQNPHLLDL
ncbi:hypothetical protein SCLCIDRAFT_49058, partial [Scleroderma citrinum Foug A]